MQAAEERIPRTLVPYLTFGTISVESSLPMFMPTVRPARRVSKAGDLLVEFAGEPIKNLYDFTDALGSKKAWRRRAGCCETQWTVHQSECDIGGAEVKRIGPMLLASFLRRDFPVAGAWNPDLIPKRSTFEISGN